MKKIVVAIDSFKGSLSSKEAGDSAAKAIRELFPESEIIVFPVSDGGEGLLSALIKSQKARYVDVYAHNPLMEIIKTSYGLSFDKTTAFIEMATISGLPLIPETRYNPLLTTTYGTGELIKDALEKGIRDFVIGIGGSATNDAGLGMLQALGFQFKDKSGHILGYGGQIMGKVFSIDTSHIHPALTESRFTVASDVANPFCGPNGAAYIFARQKGADDKMIEQLDAGMDSLRKIIFETTGKDLNNCPGTGAAGGLGGALLAFMNARIVPGIDLLLDIYNFADKIENADLIITGEGKADKQTLMGKAPYGILRIAKQKQIPVILLAGMIEDRKELEKAGFKAVYPTTPESMPLEKAMMPEVAKENIRNAILYKIFQHKH